MNGSPSVRVALFIRESGSESPCRWFYVTGIYNYFSKFPKIMSDFVAPSTEYMKGLTKVKEKMIKM